jgi:hypothetical protein
MINETDLDLPAKQCTRILPPYFKQLVINLFDLAKYFAMFYFTLSWIGRHRYLKSYMELNI